jgi:SAM-dependent methyltransferase
VSSTEAIPLGAKVRRQRKGSYGLDAPYLLPLPTLVIAWNLIHGIISKSPWPFCWAALVAAIVGFGWHSSRRGKFVVWAELLDQLNLRGDERILDIGCGRGAVLLMAAQHLTTGRAVGIDLWIRGDQSGNAMDATLKNAAAEGVAERVELHTADMTALPFDDHSFDVIVSNIAIHNVSGREKRARAIEQAVRVLRPGGRLLIADMRCTGDYQERLSQLGMTDIKRRNLGWRMWWGGPWVPTRLVTANKPRA